MASTTCDLRWPGTTPSPRPLPVRRCGNRPGPRRTRWRRIPLSRRCAKPGCGGRGVALARPYPPRPRRKGQGPRLLCPRAADLSRDRVRAGNRAGRGGSGWRGWRVRVPQPVRRSSTAAATVSGPTCAGKNFFGAWPGLCAHPAPQARTIAKASAIEAATCVGGSNPSGSGSP